MRVRAGDMVRQKGCKTRYFITKVRGDKAYFDAPNGITGSFNIPFVNLKRI